MQIQKLQPADLGDRAQAFFIGNLTMMRDLPLSFHNDLDLNPVQDLVGDDGNAQACYATPKFVPMATRLYNGFTHGADAKFTSCLSDHCTCVTLCEA